MNVIGEYPFEAAIINEKPLHRSYYDPAVLPTPELLDLNTCLAA